MDSVQDKYPYEEGNVIVLGPEIFASNDRNVICWKGNNYYVRSNLQHNSHLEKAKEYLQRVDDFILTIEEYQRRNVSAARALYAPWLMELHTQAAELHFGIAYLEK
jgi:hypothetical protein